MRRLDSPPIRIPTAPYVLSHVTPQQMPAKNTKLNFNHITPTKAYKQQIIELLIAICIHQKEVKTLKNEY